MSRDAAAIIGELFTLTKSMTARLDDPDYLIECVDRRQELMDEYDAFAKAFPEKADREKLRGVVSEIVVMDRKINSALEKQRQQTRQQLTEIRSQQNAAQKKADSPAPAGSFMKQKN